MNTLSEKLESFWLRQNIKLCPGAAEKELCAFETKYGIQFPEDFRQYLRSMNGFDESDHWMIDDNLITFLGLSQIMPLDKYWSPGFANSAGFFVFADYSISAHVYAIQLRNAAVDRNQVVVIYDKLIEVACSFTEFIEGYLKRDDAQLFPFTAG